MFAGRVSGGKPPPPQDHLSHGPDHGEVGSGFTKEPRRGSLPRAGCLARRWGRVSAGGSAEEREGERQRAKSRSPPPPTAPSAAPPPPRALLGYRGPPGPLSSGPAACPRVPRAPWCEHSRLAEGLGRILVPSSLCSVQQPTQGLGWEGAPRGAQAGPLSCSGPSQLRGLQDSPPPPSCCHPPPPQLPPPFPGAASSVALTALLSNPPWQKTVQGLGPLSC